MMDLFTGLCRLRRVGHGRVLMVCHLFGEMAEWFAASFFNRADERCVRTRRRAIPHLPSTGLYMKPKERRS